MLYREMRKLYYQKLDLILYIISHTELLPMPIDDLSHMLVPSTRLEYGILKHHCILSMNAIEREIDCINRQIERWRPDIIEDASKFHWIASAKNYLRLIADHFAMKALTQAQMARGTSKRVHPVHVLIAAREQNLLDGDVVRNPFAKAVTHLRHCESSSRARRGKVTTTTTRRDVAQTKSLPYNTGMLSKLCITLNMTELHQPQCVSYALNLYVHTVLTNVVYNAEIMEQGAV